MQAHDVQSAAGSFTTSASLLNDVERRRQWPVVIFLSVLPFVVFFWMLPFVGKHTLGNDYQSYWIDMQQYLRFSLKHGTFPLYAPGFNGGWTSSALTLGQMYHPISWIAAMIPGYWNGRAMEIVTLLRLVSLGLANVVLYLFLRRLRLKVFAAAVISFITVYNLRMLDMFRYGASLENYVAFLLLCAALGWCFLTPAKKSAFVLVAVCTYLVVTGGHPQIAFFGLLGAAFFGLIAPYYIAEMLPGQVELSRTKILNYYFIIAPAVFAGLILASWYSFPFYFEYMHESGRSSGYSFDWACIIEDSFAGSLNNFFNPYRSDVHNAFGGSSLILVAALMPAVSLVRVRVPRVIWCVWSAMLIVFVLSLGSKGPLYYYFWKYFPFGGSFRIPGRVNVLLPFLFLLLLSWFSGIPGPAPGRDCRLRKMDPRVLLLAVAFVCFVFVRTLFANSTEPAPDRWTPTGIQTIPRAAMTITLAAGAVSLASFALYFMLRRFKLAMAVVCTAAVVTQTTCVLRYGTWREERRPIMTYTQFERLQQQYLDYRPSTGDWSRTMIEEHLKWSFIEPLMARFATEYVCVDSTRQAYEGLIEHRDIDCIYVEGFDRTNAQAATDIAAEQPERVVDLKYDSFNRFGFDARTDKSCFFVFSYPRAPNWHAFLDKTRVPVYRCNGIEQCIWVSPGEHHIEFRYSSPSAVAGMALTCVAAALLTVWSLMSLRNRPLRYALAFLALVCFSLLFAIWYDSLYAGKSIGTRYSWSNKAMGHNRDSRYNLAYGKKTTMSSAETAAYNRHSSRGVDGARLKYHGFATEAQQNAWWMVDLGKVEPVGKILIFKRGKAAVAAMLPLDILVSGDGQQWRNVTTITADVPGDAWALKMKEVEARYVLLQTQAVGYISLAEVEVYKAGD